MLGDLVMKVLLPPLVLSLSVALGSSACTSNPETPEDAVTRSAGEAAASDSADTPALAVATVASLISVNDVMVREPERFKKALCSDENIYDLEFDGSRFALR